MGPKTKTPARFAEPMSLQRGIDGMLLEQSAAIWCHLLDAQESTWPWSGVEHGAYLEIGTYKGKSASILAYFAARNGARVTIVDPEVTGEARNVLNASGAKFDLIEDRSEYLRVTPFFSSSFRRISWAHIDGMHSYAAVLSDLAVCEDLIGDFGVICIDDFHTDLYPQIPAAVYAHLSSNTDLSLFLVGFNKAYLCRNGAKPYFHQYVRDSLIWGLEDMGYDLSLVKTDRHDRFDAYSITPLFNGERRYGPFVKDQPEK